MGVDRTDHIVFGWKLPYKLIAIDGKEINVWDDDKYLPYIEGWKGEKFILIPDGMSGDYTVFGLDLNSGGDKYEGWDFVYLDFKNLEPEEVKTKFKELFPTMNLPDTEPSLFIFSHFS